MLEGLIRRFYDEDGYLKDETRVVFDRYAMEQIIKEFAELKMNCKKEVANEL